jgi:predicted DNA binding protein
MATVAEFRVPADQFPLGRLFEGVPGAAVELERVVPTQPALIPYVWVRGVTPEGLDDIRAAATDVPAIESLRVVDSVDGRYLLRLEWGPEYQGVLRGLTEMDGTLVSGVGSGDSWLFEVRSDHRDDVAAFQAYCREHGISLTVVTLQSLSAVDANGAYGLTESQREALVVAYSRGYYDTPRAVTLEELASEVGITGQAFGARLRRGTRRLLGNTVVASSEQ